VSFASREILRRSCRLVDDPLNLAFRVAGEVAKSFLRFAAEIFCSADYAIIIHGSASLCEICPFNAEDSLTTKGALTTVADQAHKNSHADCNCERKKRAMLDFLGKAAQGIVAKLRCLAADFCRLVAHKIGAPAKPVGHAAQHRSNGLSNVVGSVRGTRGRSDTDTFQTLFHGPQAPFDFTDIGGHRAGISGLTKHHEPPLESER
jgi:hypothetical protein